MRFCGVVVLLVGTLLSFGCGVESTLRCEAPTDCMREGDVGVCQGGYCAFRDSGCASAWRWDGSAATDVAGECMMPNGCSGQEHVLLSKEGTVEAQSTFFDFSLLDRFAAAKAVDGNLQTSWFSTGANPDASPTSFRWRANAGDTVCVAEIEIAGNGHHSDPAYRENYGFQQVTIEVLSGDQKVFSRFQRLNGTPDPDVMVETGGVLGTEVVLWFFGHENGGSAGFAELTINGLR